MADFTMAELWSGYLLPGIIILIQILAVVVPLMICMAMLTYFERKVMAAMQLRMGPNVVGPFGLLQAFADGGKLLFKETILPTAANKVVFLAAPIVTFTLSLIAWAVIPFDYGWVIADINVGILYIFAVSSRDTVCLRADIRSRRVEYACMRSSGLLRELNLGPLAPLAGIIPRD